MLKQCKIEWKIELCNTGFKHSLKHGHWKILFVQFTNGIWEGAKCQVQIIERVIEIIKTLEKGELNGSNWSSRASNRMKNKVGDKTTTNKDKEIGSG